MSPGPTVSQPTNRLGEGSADRLKAGLPSAARDRGHPAMQARASQLFQRDWTVTLDIFIPILRVMS